MKKVNAQYNHWTVLYILDRVAPKNRQCICRCDCGRLYKRTYSHIKNNECKVCFICQKRKHGDTKTRLYRIWCAMKRRCSTSKGNYFKYYGSGSIKVCNNWKFYNNFKKWAIETGYNERLTLDRIDNNQGYSPENCRWTTQHVQNLNKRKPTNPSGYTGVYKRRVKGGYNYVARISLWNRSITIGTFKTASDAVKARDEFIINNNLYEYSLQVLKRKGDPHDENQI